MYGNEKEYTLVKMQNNDIRISERKPNRAGKVRNAKTARSIIFGKVKFLSTHCLSVFQLFGDEPEEVD